MSHGALSTFFTETPRDPGGWGGAAWNNLRQISSFLPALNLCWRSSAQGLEAFRITLLISGQCVCKARTEWIWSEGILLVFLRGSPKPWKNCISENVLFSVSDFFFEKSCPFSSPLYVFSFPQSSKILLCVLSLPKISGSFSMLMLWNKSL